MADVRQAKLVFAMQFRHLRRIKIGTGTRASLRDLKEGFDGAGGNDPSVGTIICRLKDVQNGRKRVGRKVLAACIDAASKTIYDSLQEVEIIKVTWAPGFNAVSEPGVNERRELKKPT